MGPRLRAWGKQRKGEASPFLWDRESNRNLYTLNTAAELLEPRGFPSPLPWGRGRTRMEPPLQPGPPPPVFESLSGAELLTVLCSAWLVSVGPSSGLDVPGASHKASPASHIAAGRRRRRRLARLAASYLAEARSCFGPRNLSQAFRPRGLEGGLSRRLENDPGRLSSSRHPLSAMSWMFKRWRGWRGRRGRGAGGNGVAASPDEPDLPRVSFAFRLQAAQLVFIPLAAPIAAGEINAESWLARGGSLGESRARALGKYLSRAVGGLGLYAPLLRRGLFSPCALFHKTPVRYPLCAGHCARPKGPCKTAPVPKHLTIDVYAQTCKYISAEESKAGRVTCKENAGEIASLRS